MKIYKLLNYFFFLMFCGKNTFIGSPLHLLLVFIVLIQFLIVLIWMNKMKIEDFYNLIKLKILK